MQLRRAAELLSFFQLSVDEVVIIIIVVVTAALGRVIGSARCRAALGRLVHLLGGLVHDLLQLLHARREHVIVEFFEGLLDRLDLRGDLGFLLTLEFITLLGDEFAGRERRDFGAIFKLGMLLLFLVFGAVLFGLAHKLLDLGVRKAGGRLNTNLFLFARR